MNKINSVCPYCGAGCKINLCVENGRIIKAEGANGVTNQGELCLKGLYGWDFLNDNKLLTARIHQPMIRRQKGLILKLSVGMKRLSLRLKSYSQLKRNTVLNLLCAPAPLGVQVTKPIL